MREIKFRVWNTLLKKYIPDDLVHISSDGSFLFGFFSYIKVDFYKYRDDIFRGENIAEQFTGLKDINGREIYEGDIVSVRDSPVVVEDEEGVCYVAWSSVLAGFLLKGSDAYKFDEQSLSDLKLIVIGNIHEDYELLEEK